MAYLIHVTTGDDISAQIQRAEHWAIKHGHKIVQVLHDDHESASRIAGTLGCELIETDHTTGPQFIKPATAEEPTHHVAELPDETTGAPPPVVGGPPPVGPPLDAPKATSPLIDAPKKVGKKGTRRSGPTTKNRKELERLKPIIEELSGQSAKACAKILNEKQVALPSGKAGTWQGTQVTRVRKHLEDIYGSTNSATT